MEYDLEHGADKILLTAYWIAFGPHGPRAQTPPGEGTKVFLYTMVGVAAAGVIFGVTRYFARPPPRSMNKEWQLATDEYMKVRKQNNIVGDRAEARLYTNTLLIRHTFIGEQDRANQLRRRRGLQGHRKRPERPQAQGVNPTASTRADIDGGGVVYSTLVEHLSRALRNVSFARRT
jgi:hypothetical protein